MNKISSHTFTTETTTVSSLGAILLNPLLKKEKETKKDINIIYNCPFDNHVNIYLDKNM